MSQELPIVVMALSRKEIGRIRVSKHVERQYQHPAFTQGVVTVLLGFKRAIPGMQGRRVQQLRHVGDVERVHINALQLHRIEHEPDACENVALGEPAKMLLSIMTDRTFRIARNKFIEVGPEGRTPLTKEDLVLP